MNKYLYAIVIITTVLLMQVVSSCSGEQHQNNPPASPGEATQKSEQDNMLAEGDRLFNSNCTACHAVNEKIVGPPLRDISKKHSEKWLIDFIRDSQKMIKDGDPEAVALSNEHNGQVMVSYKQFSDDQIKAILLYIEEESKK